MPPFFLCHPLPQVVGAACEIHRPVLWNLDALGDLSTPALCFSQYKFHSDETGLGRARKKTGGGTWCGR